MLTRILSLALGMLVAAAVPPDTGTAHAVTFNAEDAGLFGKVAGGVVQQGAWSMAGSEGSTAGRVAASAAAGAASGAVSEYAYGSRNQDELAPSYRLQAGSGAVLVGKSEKRKAKSDGEDLLTPVVQRAAEDVAAVMRGGHAG